MNYSTAVFLINPNVRAIVCVYEKDEKRVVFKSLESALKVDDLVVVPTQTRHGFTVVKIIEVDVEVDFDSADQVQWIVDKVDLESYKLTMEREQEALAAIKSAEVRKKREDLAKSLLADQGDQIKALPIASM